MRRAILGAAVVAALLTGVVAAALLGSIGDGDTTTVEITRNDVGDTVDGLPRAVWLARAELQLAAESGDYEALRPLLSDDFGYTFGGPFDGGPIAYWQQLERTTDVRPLETLAALLELPYALTRGTYVWPWAYTVESADALAEHERGLLAPLGPVDTLFPPGAGYLGWRTGIEPDGTWAFFVAGD